MPQFREALEVLERAGYLFRVSEPRSTLYEVARELRARDGEGAVLIENPVLPDGTSTPFRIAGGVASNVSAIATILGLKKRREFRALLKRSIEEGVAAQQVESGPVKEVGLTDFDLGRDLPILRHYQGDPGLFITAGIVVVKDLDSGLFSASYHRMMPIGPRRLVLRAVEGRKLHSLIRRADDTGRPLDVAVSIGSNIGLMIAAATPAEDVDKLGIAGAIMGEPVELTSCETVDAVMPADAQVVLEAKILPGEREKEGPFYEILGKDVVRDQPVLEVKKIWRREKAIYQAILPAGREHELLMGLPVEALIEEAVSRVVDVKDVCMTPAGATWVEVALSIRKKLRGQPMVAALAAISAHKSLKRVIVVDEDVEVSNYEEVMRAVVQRADPARDYKIITDIRGSSLDHSNIRTIRVGGKLLEVELPQSKAIIDATMKGPRELFERPVIPFPARDKSREEKEGSSHC